MCMACLEKVVPPDKNPMIVGKESIAKVFEKPYFILNRSVLHLANNKRIDITPEMVEEIKNNAVALLVTGVDLSTDIWAIQWGSDYIVKSF